MAHSHDRTLLAKLGFEDPDKKNPKHDLATRYLTQPEQALRLCSRIKAEQRFHPLSDEQKLERDELARLVAVWKEAKAHPVLKKYPTAFDARRDDLGDEWTEARNRADSSFRGIPEKTIEELVGGPETIVKSSRIEVPISKGGGQYKTTVGFLDAVIGFDQHQNRRSTGKKDFTAWDDVSKEKLNYALVVEVKVGQVDANEVLRQMLLYKEYVTSAMMRAETFFWLLAAAFDMTQPELDALRAEGIDVIRLGGGFERWCQETSKAGPVEEI